MDGSSNEMKPNKTKQNCFQLLVSLDLWLLQHVIRPNREFDAKTKQEWVRQINAVK